MPPPFDAARFKVIRARQHIKELSFEVHYLADRRIRRPEFNIDREEFKKAWHESVIRPRLMALMLGDTVHNLRSALDHMAIEVVGHNSGNPRNVYFPFAENRADLERQIKKKHFDRASPAAIAELDSLQPYKGGNVALRGLHDLDVADKHRLILPAGHSPRPVHTLGEFPAGTWPDDVCPKCGSQLPHAGTDTTPWAFMGKLVFGPADPFSGEEIVPTLHHLAQMVDAIIDRFSEICR